MDMTWMCFLSLEQHRVEMTSTGNDIDMILLIRMILSENGLHVLIIVRMMWNGNVMNMIKVPQKETEWI